MNSTERMQRRIMSKGYAEMGHSSVTICSIVRDCNKNLLRTIPAIEEIRNCFKSSKVIVFENDSIDGTRQTLVEWKKDYQNVNIHSDNYGQQTIPNEDISGVNRFFSEFRISKMIQYRNRYLSLLNEKSCFKADFVIVVDLDIGELDINGVAHSFGLTDQWDVVCANGYFYDASFRRRYYDTYPLVELGNENSSQTETSIADNRITWSFFRPGMPLIPVYSAYGGMAIYKFEAIENRKYSVIRNNDERVEVRCDHFSLCQDIRNAGFSRILINPAMTLNYLRFDRGLIRKFMNNAFSKS
jgi:hypothetical protein